MTCEEFERINPLDCTDSELSAGANHLFDCEQCKKTMIEFHTKADPITRFLGGLEADCMMERLIHFHATDPEAV